MFVLGWLANKLQRLDYLYSPCKARGSQIFTTMPWFYMGSGYANSGSWTCRVGTFPMEPSLQPKFLSF